MSIDCLAGYLFWQEKDHEDIPKIIVNLIKLAPLKQIHDNYPKYLLTLDEVFDDMNYDGIEKKNVLKWLIS